MPDVNADMQVDALYSHLRDNYNAANEWYMQEKRRKALVSKLLRIVSLVLAVTGGAVPLVTPLWQDLNPALGYLLLATAAGLQLIDRYFGFSSAWVRYVTAALALNGAVIKLDISYRRAQDADKKWDVLATYAAKFDEILVNETADWNAQFMDLAAKPEYLKQSDGKW